MQDLRINVGHIDLQIREYACEGDAIIFLHFGGGNLRVWQRVVSYFQERYRLILVDLRGHGKSDRPATGYHIDEMAQDVIGVMAHLELEQAHIVGSSLGAEVALSIAANHPEKVHSIVCDGALSSEYGPYGTWEGSEAEFEAHIASQLERIRNKPDTLFDSVDALVEARRELFEKYGWWNAYVEAVERYGAYAVAGKYRTGMGKQVLESYMPHYFRYRFEDYYRRVKCPLLMLVEKDLDDEREKAAMQGLCELAVRGEIVEIDGWVHPYGWLLDPENASKAILEFLAK